LGLSGRIPRRVDAATKTGLLDLVDEAVAAGSPHQRTAVRPKGVWTWARTGLHGNLAIFSASTSTLRSCLLGVSG
jgi:hypothetical protein